MPLTLHAATIPTWLQITASTRGLVDKAEEWCNANDKAPQALLSAALSDDMWPFARQVKCVWMHSAHALNAAKLGQFEPELSAPPSDFDGLRALLDEARDTMLAVSPDDLESLAENDLNFALGGEVRMRFTAQNFLLSFSNPNFFFHAATAYDILRMKGAQVGKRDFLGAPAMKG